MTYQPPFNGGRINASIGGNTAGAAGLVSSGTMVLAGGNNITLSQAGNAITISGGAGGGGGGVAIAGGGTTYTSGTANFVGSGALTIASTTGQSLNFSVPSQSNLSATGIVSITNNGNTISIGAPAFSAGINTLGNTSGTTGFASNQIVFAGGNNITLSQATATNGNTVSISGANQTNQNLSLYALGNTTQNSSTLLNASNLSFNGIGGVSVGYSNGSIQISGATGGGGGGGGGIAIANSETTYSSGTANFIASGALTIASTTGQSFNLSVPQTSSLMATGAVSISTTGGTISVGAPLAGTIPSWEPNPLAAISLGGSSLGNSAPAFFYKLQPQAYINASQLMQFVSITLGTSSNTSMAISMSLAAGIFSANGSTLSLITQSSGSISYTYSNTSDSNTASVNGIRGLSLPMNVNMSPGNYWIGMWSRTSISGASFSMSNMYAYNNTGVLVYSGAFGQSTNASQAMQEGVGLFATSTSALPTSAALTAITQSVLSRNKMPYMIFKNTSW